MSESASDMDSDTNSHPKSCPFPFISAIWIKIRSYRWFISVSLFYSFFSKKNIFWHWNSIVLTCPRQVNYDYRKTIWLNQSITDRQARVYQKIWTQFNDFTCALIWQRVEWMRLWFAVKHEILPNLGNKTSTSDPCVRPSLVHVNKVERRWESHFPKVKLISKQVIL